MGLSTEDMRLGLQKYLDAINNRNCIVLPHGYSIEEFNGEKKEELEPRKMTPRQQRMKDKREAQKQRRLCHDN